MSLVRPHETQIPKPEKRELVTQLTISESELEAELKLRSEPEKNGLRRFVTAPTSFNEEKVFYKGYDKNVYNVNKHFSLASIIIGVDWVEYT